MNLIVPMLDSFRQDHVSAYNKGVGPFEGIPACQTPSIDRFAESAVVFDNAYPEGLPTIPVRCALIFPFLYLRSSRMPPPAWRRMSSVRKPCGRLPEAVAGSVQAQTTALAPSPRVGAW